MMSSCKPMTVPARPGEHEQREPLGGPPAYTKQGA